LASVTVGLSIRPPSCSRPPGSFRKDADYAHGASVLLQLSRIIPTERAQLCLARYPMIPFTAGPYMLLTGSLRGFPSLPPFLPTLSSCVIHFTVICRARRCLRHFGRPFVKRFALCYRTVVMYVCLPCMSVTLVYCGKTAGCIKMKLGMVVGLSPGHIVLDGDPAPLSQKGVQPSMFSLYPLWPNGGMDYDATWYGGRPRPRRHCVIWGPSHTSPKRGHSSPQFLAHV